MTRFVSFILIAALTPLFTKAQEKDSLDLFNLSLEELGKLSVYSTSRTAIEDADDAPANVTIITAQHIKERGYKSLIDILEGMPDFKVDRGVDPRWMNDVTSRGIRYMDKIIILLDGVRVSSPTNEIISVFENYPVHFAEQIEIVYGPSSALYGADAFAGIINIVSKKSSENTMINGTLTGGMYNSFMADVTITRNINEDFSLLVSGSYFSDQQPDLSEFYEQEYAGIDEQLQTGTFNTIFGPITPNTPVNPNKAFPLEASALFAKVTYKNFTLSSFKNHAHNPTSTANRPSNSVYNEDQLFGHDIFMVTGKHVKESDKLISSSQIIYSTYNLDSHSNFRNVFTELEPAFKFARSWKLKAEQLFTFNFSPEIKLTTGATVERFFSTPRSNDLASPVDKDDIHTAVIVNSVAPNNPMGIPAELITSNYNNVGFLAQVDWKRNQWNMVFGIRSDKDDRYERTINPRAAFVYNPSQRFTGKLLIGAAYLAPSPQNIYDRFGTFMTSDDGTTYSSSFFQLPNQDLEPQKISTTELNLKYFFFENLCLNFSSYYSTLSSLISPVTSLTAPTRIEQLYPNMEYEIGGNTWPIDLIQINDNLGEAEIYGGSMILNYLWRPGSKLSGDFFLMSSFVDGRLDIDEGGPIQRRNLPGVAPWINRMGITMKSEKFSIHTLFSVIGSQRTIGVNTVKDSDGDGNPLNDTEYEELDGYHLLNIHINYELTDKLTLQLNGRNLTNQRYRNVNIGANPSIAAGGGSAAVEFSNGAPQNPIRITGGIRFVF